MSYIFIFLCTCICIACICNTRKKLKSTIYENMEYSSKMSIKNIQDLKKGQSIMTNMMKDLDDICTKNNISYFIFAGNLLGSCLYKGWIPWDGDFDIYVFYNDYDKLKQLLKYNPPKNTWYQTLETDTNYTKWFGIQLPNGLYPSGKLRHLKSCYLNNQDREQWHSGFQIDINLYNIIGNNIVLSNEMKGDKRVQSGIKATDIFPLKRVKYENIMLNAPKNPEMILDLHYGKKWRKKPKIKDRYPHEGVLDPNNTCKFHFKMYPELYFQKAEL